MRSYLVKRLLLWIPTFLGVSLLVYLIMDFTPGDPARLILGERAGESQLAMMRDSLGLGRPFLVRYGEYGYRLLFHGDWGTSYRTRLPVLPEILKKFPPTFRLAVLGAFFSSLVGISGGIWSAVKRYTALDRIFTSLALALAAIPGFWLGMLLMLLFSLGLGILPSHGVSTWRHFVLPVAALTFPASAGILRLTRSLMLETLGQDYIRTARAKGVGEIGVVFVHGLKNALPPIITSLGTHFGHLLGGAVITETVFAIPGLGTHLIEAIRMKDTPVVLGVTVFLSVFFSGIMLLVDLGCAALDPRIRGKPGGGA